MRASRLPLVLLFGVIAGCASRTPPPPPASAEDQSRAGFGTDVQAVRDRERPDGTTTTRDDSARSAHAAAAAEAPPVPAPAAVRAESLDRAGVGGALIGGGRMPGGLGGPATERPHPAEGLGEVDGAELALRSGSAPPPPALAAAPALAPEGRPAVGERDARRRGDARPDPAKAPAGEATRQPAQKASTWKRDRARSTFARVYVGDGNALELVSLQVTVTVEGPRARTVVDHIFRNPHDRQLEGTFEYPLPTGASPSYFAMFLGQTRDTVPPRFAARGQTPPLPPDALAKLTPAEMVKHVDSTDWGTLREARVVGKQKALETYEEIVRGRIDPALLEYAGGNTFSGRVFPIPPKGYNRVLIAYEELLPVVQEQVLYRYALPDCKLAELQFTVQANAAECRNPTFRPDGAERQEGGSRLTFQRTWKDQGPGGEVQFRFTPATPEVQVVSGRQSENSSLYAYVRVRPPVPSAAQTGAANQAVFLLDTSLSEHPDRFGVSMKLLRKILEGDPDIKQFNILTFNVAPAWVEPKGWIENSPAGREQALARLDGVLLEGATDLSAALEKLARPGFEIAAGTPVNVFLLSDGQLTWGETDVAALVAGFEARCPYPTRFHCYRTGIGADNLELFDALTRRGGGIFTCFSEADLPAAAAAHRHHGFHVDRVRFVGGPAASEVLVAGRRSVVYPGGELVVAAQFAGNGRANLVLEGEFLGKKTVYEYPVEITAAHELAPRGWGEIAVASLQALNDPRLDSLIVALSQQFGIGGREASFLVLENAADYKRLNLEEERGKTVPGGDVGRFLDESWKNLGKAVTAREGVERFLARVEPRVKLLSGPNGDHLKKLLQLLTEKNFELAPSSLQGKLVRTKDVDAAYLAARDQERRLASTYLTEAKRRLAAGDADGAVRVLSSIVEEYPGRGDALRLVGYRLLDLRQPAEAVRLFAQVERGRPFEPHSYRDLARSLEQSGQFGLAALQYELVLAGTWHNRFGDALKMVVHEEYAHMMQEAIRQRAVSPAVANHFGERLEYLARALPPSDLRVTISWNTDATDVDLWVIEPDGTKCFYQHNRTKNGGELSQDQTQGYGPERYQVRKALPGVYTVLVHYYRANPNLLAGESHVNVVVTRFAGTPQEQVQRHTVVLKQANEQLEVCKVKF
jgi:tetratricopeptide (TPR) repeat protein